MEPFALSCHARSIGLPSLTTYASTVRSHSPPAPEELVEVISDTHGLLRPEAMEALQGVGHIMHAGDIGDPKHLDALALIAPLTAIRGNIDRSPWPEGLPKTACLTIHELNIYIVHDRKDLQVDPETEGWDVVISGHSHKPSIEEAGFLLWLTPGVAAAYGCQSRWRFFGRRAAASVS